MEWMEFVKEMVPKISPDWMKCLLRKYGSEKKIHTKAKYMKFQNPGIKDTLKPSRKKTKQKQMIYKEFRIRITSDF